MKFRRAPRAAGFAALAIVLIAAFGCGKKAGIHTPYVNQRPAVSLTAAPVSISDTSFYAYQICWSGYDPDGRVDHYMYAVDPGAETTWVSTAKNQQTLFFSATHGLLGGLDPLNSISGHTFVIKAVDNQGLPSELVERYFLSKTVAPIVAISSPRPSPTSTALVTPAMRVSWTGTDPDGQKSQKPVKYKYKLLPRGNTEIDIGLADTKAGPDSLRRFFEERNFAGWDSVGGDTTTVQYVGLVPNQTYLFLVIGYDEAGAYNANFSRNTNILEFSVGYAGTQGPKITAWNDFFFYSMPTGLYAPSNPASWQYLEIPAGQKISFNWVGTPSTGADIDWYRWRIGGNVEDETARTNESTDWGHWSQKSANTTSMTVGPFTTSAFENLYIEAQDNNGMLSCLTVVLQPIVPTMDTPTGKELLIVDDTRLEADQFVSGVQKPYTKTWPSAAELDTFFYARGGVPWRSTRIASPQQYSKPGIFTGYTYDTLGTRMGFSNASMAVPFSLLSKYRHIIWMVDSYGGMNTSSPTNSLTPMSALHYMCTPGKNNTFSTYTYAGGKMWLCGGLAGYASLREFNAIGADNNDNDFGFSPIAVFAGSGYAHHVGKEELIPGRLMYDGAHWQSLMVSTQGGATVTRAPASTIKAKWTDQPGYKFANPEHRPDFNLLPSKLFARTVPPTAGSDSLPPTRTSSATGSFWNNNSLAFEFLEQPNFIIEDMDSDPVRERLEVALDTLYDVNTTQLLNDTGQEKAAMTWYHGTVAADFIFTGFPIWQFRKVDCQSLIDFVLQNMWGLTKSTSPAFATSSARYANPFRGTPSTGISAAERNRVPVVRLSGK